MITTTKYLLSTILIGVLAIITYATINWWAESSVWNLSDFDPLVKLLVSSSGALLWLGIITINLKYQLPRPTKKLAVNIILAIVSAFITLFTISILLNFTGMLLAALSLFLIAVFALLQNHNRAFFYPFVAIIFSVPVVYLLTHQYRLDRLMMALTGTDNETLNFIVNTSQPLDDIGINTPKFFLLLFDYKFGFMPTFILVVVMVGLWLTLLIRLLKNKTTQLFYKRLALFITAFFIIQAVLSILISIGVLGYTLSANLMPISTNPSYWLFFVVLLFAMIKIFGNQSSNAIQTLENI